MTKSKKRRDPSVTQKVSRKKNPKENPDMSSPEPKPQRTREELLVIADEFVVLQEENQKALAAATAELFKDLDANQQQAVRVFSQGTQMIRARR